MLAKKKWLLGSTAITAILLVSVFTFVCVAEAKTITLRMATGAKPVQRFYKAAEKWMKVVEERTNGAVEIKAFHSGQLYMYHELADPLIAGDIDLALGTPGTFGKLAPSSALDWIGWEVPSEAEGWRAIRELCEHPDFLATINGRFQELGVKLLFYSPLSIIKGPLTVDRPVRTMEDLQGLLVYAPSPSVADFVKALGGKTVFVPTGEVYTALQRGTFQGLLSQQELYFAFKLYEQTKYLTDYIFSAGLMPFFISMKAWDKLPENVQKVMMDTSREVQAEWFGGQLKFDDFILSKIKEKLEIITLTPDEKARWEKALTASHEKAASINPRTRKVWQLWNEIRSK